MSHEPPRRLADPCTGARWRDFLLGIRRGQSVGAHVPSWCSRHGVDGGCSRRIGPPGQLTPSPTRRPWMVQVARSSCCSVDPAGLAGLWEHHRIASVPVLLAGGIFDHSAQEIEVFLPLPPTRTGRVPCCGSGNRHRHGDGCPDASRPGWVVETDTRLFWKSTMTDDGVAFGSSRIERRAFNGQARLTFLREVMRLAAQRLTAEADGLRGAAHGERSAGRKGQRNGHLDGPTHAAAGLPGPQPCSGAMQGGPIASR